MVKTFNFHRFDHKMQMGQKKVDPRLFRDESTRQSILCLLYSATCGDLTALKRSFLAPVFYCRVGEISELYDICYIKRG